MFTVVALISLVVLFAPTAPAGPPVVKGLDKVVHAALFGALACTSRWRFGSGLRVFLAVAAYAVLSELIQRLLLPQRSGDPYDAVADLAGATVGWLLAANGLRRAR